MRTGHFRACLRLAMLIVACTLCTSARSQPVTQTIQLVEGWNAVFLEVDPVDRMPNSLFRDLPVDIVARYFTPVSPVQFISDPSDAPWNEPGWGVWYARHRPDAFLSNLHTIAGGHAYLVNATADHEWRVTGTALFRRIQWRADSLNFLGFPVDESSPPTFAEFFEGAGGRIGQRVYRLDQAGRWRPVASLSSTPMRAGEAYWVSCAGRTDYQGPLEVRFPGLGELGSLSSGPEVHIGFRNNLSEPVAVTIEVVPGSGDLRLVQVVRDPDTLVALYPELTAPITEPSLEGGAESSVRLAVVCEATDTDERTCLLKVSTDLGVRFWLPVRARSLW